MERTPAGHSSGVEAPEFEQKETEKTKVPKPEVTVTGTCHIAGRGLAIITDEAFSASAAERARGCTRIRILGGCEPLELAIRDVESVLVKGDKEFLGFLVAVIDDGLAADIVNREIQVL